MPTRISNSVLLLVLTLSMLLNPSPSRAWDGALWADYAAFLSPITEEVKANCRAVLARGKEQGRVEGRMGQFGDSITYSFAYFRNILVQGPADNETGHDYGPILSWLAYGGDKPADEQSFYSDLGKGSDYGCYSGWEIAHATRYDVPTHPVEVGNGSVPGNFSWALLMWGTNDVNHSTFRADSYRSGYRSIIQSCIDLGVVPVLSTIPPRADEMDNGHVDQCNAEIRALAEEFKIPLVDYFSLVTFYQPKDWWGTLIKDDGVHPSSTTGGGSFSKEALTTTDGYSARTKLSLDMAEKLRRIVFEDGPADVIVSATPSSAGRLKAGYR